MYLKTLTFTGLDECTDLDRALSIASHHPFVEFGVLLSPSNGTKGKNRYPSYDKVSEIAIKFPANRLAGHLCGTFASLSMENNHTLLPILPFGRIQLNIGREVKGWSRTSPEAVEVASGEGLNQFIARVPNRVILQLSDHLHPFYDRVTEPHDIVYDASAGTGKYDDSYPPVPGWNKHTRLVGFAGGLGPHNLRERISGLLTRYEQPVPFALDMETHIRTDEWLDLDKVEECCEIVRGFWSDW